ncbi:hypothetical protein [Microbulbifer sp. TYP-18]|uniref:hypothetical protein n=1 Tax=Microbulbifer sp. TYP-18 TaxID=3230024 RepID=UPI0034C6CAD8
MIRARAYETGSDSSMPLVRFVVEDDSGNGIRQVMVYDDVGGSYGPFEPVQSCDQYLEFEIGPIARNRFPLWAEGEDCAGQPTSRQEIGPLLTPVQPPPGSPGVPMPCSPTWCPPAPDCDIAVNEVGEAQGEMADVCGNCARLRSSQRNAIAEAVLLAILAAVLFALAALFSILAFQSGPWGVAFAILAIASTAAAIKFSGEAHVARERAESLGQQAEACEANLADLRIRLDDALRRISQHCCEHCVFVPLTAPC